MNRASESGGRECTHCGTAVPPRRTPDSVEEPAFCCGGCRAVYRALHSAGLDGYYDLRRAKTARPPPPGTAAPDADGSRRDERTLAREFDSTPFLERFADRREGGVRRIELRVDGVHCSGCVWLIEQMPSRIDGVADARLNLARARLTLRWNQEETPLSEIVGWLETFGYDAHPVREDGSGGSERAERQLLRRLGVSSALAANVMLLAFALYAGLDRGGGAGLYQAFRWTSFALATAVVLYGGSTFFRRAWGSIRPLFADPRQFDPTRLSIDIPISLGILGGWMQSTVATFRGQGEIWFDSIAILIAALLAARWLQMRGQRIAREASNRLLNVVPTVARRLETDSRPDVAEAARKSVETAALEAGDFVEVRPSETVPVDGFVRAGASSLEVGVLTGESEPERVEPGDRVYAGASNVGGRLIVEVEAAGEQSRVGSLMEWVERGGDGSAPVVRLADRLAGIFVLTVLAAAFATWAIWSAAGSPHAIQYAVALLVIACPCALGMATPLAMTVGVGRAARTGIFVKEDGVFERLDDLGELILDKTGTVTAGSMRVVETAGAEEALRRAVALESESTHPIARALQRWDPAASEEEFALEEVEEIPGRGIRGLVDGDSVRVGRPDWVRGQLDDRGRDSNLEPALRAAVEAGRTPVAVAVSGELRAAVSLGDPVRRRAAEFVGRMRDGGVRVTMLSGDHPEVVDRVARRLGLDVERASGHCSPEEKREYVRQRREELKGSERPTVAMVGDGVNDAAALRASDVGIAVGGAAAPSFTAADVFTTRGGMEPLFELTYGAEDVLRTVRRNIGMSVAYNAVGITAAAAGLVTPLAAAIAMPISSVAVVLSSVLQGAFDRPAAEEFAESVEPREESTSAASLATPRG